MPMRQRRVDRAILSESSSDPIDSEDQKLIISQFRSDNDRRLRYSLRLLLVWIVAQTPLETMMAKPRLRPNSIALLVVANVLVLINGVFEFPEWERRGAKEGKVSYSMERQSPLGIGEREMGKSPLGIGEREIGDGESPYNSREIEEIGAIGESTNFGGNFGCYSGDTFGDTFGRNSGGNSGGNSGDNFGDNFGRNFERPKTTASWWILQVVSFRGVSVLTGVVLLQLLFSLWSSPRTHLLFVAVPLANLLLMVYVRKSHEDVHSEIIHLDSLRYKFKSA